MSEADKVSKEDSSLLKLENRITVAKEKANATCERLFCLSKSLDIERPTEPEKGAEGNSPDDRFEESLMRVDDIVNTLATMNHYIGKIEDLTAR